MKVVSQFCHKIGCHGRPLSDWEKGEIASLLSNTYHLVKKEE